VQEEDLDEFPGASGVAVDSTGCVPERVMLRREHARFPRAGESGGSGQSARLVFEDLKIMIEHDGLPVTDRDARMSGDEGSAVVEQVPPKRAGWRGRVCRRGGQGRSTSPASP